MLRSLATARNKLSKTRLRTLKSIATKEEAQVKYIGLLYSSTNGCIHALLQKPIHYYIPFYAARAAINSVIPKSSFCSGVRSYSSMVMLGSGSGA